MNIIVKYRRVISILAIIAGFIIPYLGINAELIDRDQAYQALCTRDYLNCPLAMLTFYVGHLWTDWLGDTLTNFKVLAAIFYQFSIGAACLYLYKRTGKLLLSSGLFLTINMALRYVVPFLYGWDAGMYPCFTLLIIATLSYEHQPTHVKVIAMGLLSGLLAMFRITNLAVFPLILMFIIFTRRTEGDNVLKRVTYDSAAGLIAFAAAAMAAILLMSSGHIGAYIDSLNPDNIINGHFDIGFVGWRWKDTFRKVIGMYFPMAVCFACACYMMRTKRNRRINMTACLLISATMTFCLYKTYKLHYEYAVGFFEGFFLIIVLIPLLYNQTHTVKRAIPVLPLMTITAYALSAGVGSDGFIERLMTVNTIPLVCIYVYPLFQRLMRYFLIFAFASTLVVAGLGNAQDLRNRVNDFSSKPHLEGIAVNDLDLELSSFSEISDAIESIRDEGLTVAVVGTNRYSFDFVYNELPAYNLQHFHYFDTENDIRSIIPLLGQYDYILLATGKPEYPNTETYLQEHGYPLVEEAKEYRLFGKKPMSQAKHHDCGRKYDHIE